jgi:hypothetical protein
MPQILPALPVSIRSLLPLVCASAMLAQTAPPRVFLLDASELDRVRAEGDSAVRRKLVAEADRLSEMTPRSVLEKTITPASGDKHDYFSLGPYWWPDPARPDGLPYVRRDGETNPESRRNTDTEAFARTCGAIELLGTAYYLTGDERYAAKASGLARTWFLDPATRMNPNLQHAQAIPGITDGRGIGIIEGQSLMRANEGLALLAASPAWTAADRAAMLAWNEQFYHWLTTSKNGRQEQAWHNNHGTWYDVQVSHLALVLGRTDEARLILRAGLYERLAKHIEPDGRQPHELERTNSLGYSIYNLEALFFCARLAEFVGVDWWRFATADGRSLRAALGLLAPYVDPRREWPWKEIHAANRARLIPLLRKFMQRRTDVDFEELLRQADPDPDDKPWRFLAEESRG